ncbi:hypothetical protein G7078_07050 [Sphingomonas sinipercae]|uniref:Lipoprotein n=1 Tax=Sphingomonas sinipercae TaxID=2714944 RepID=A0A6G7ZNJ3_9SPHN|nr:hypothetical protein [Sphingomonas sinipercae]QIL02567.1 hypothetical protein G7078_07050 [Sphingomonas sinipercae]
MKKFVLVAATALTLSACSSVGGEGGGFGLYTAVPVRPVNVGNGSMTVIPPRAWNKQRRLFFDDVPYVEDWTLNGPLLDDMMFIAGLPDRRTLVRQRSSDSQQVPMFRSNMTAPEIVSMLESAYRVRGGAVDFKTLALAPRQFLGVNGFQLDFEHLDSDELWRRGRAVGAVVNGRLYLIMLDAARSHYYADTLRDFEAMAASARLRR